MKEVSLTNLVQHIIDNDVLPFLTRYKGDAEYEGDPFIDRRILKELVAKWPAPAFPPRIDYVVREGGTHLMFNNVKLADHCWSLFNSEPNVRLVFTHIRYYDGQVFGRLTDVQVKRIGKDRALRLLGLKKERVR